MKRTGAWLVRYALEQLPISHAFGIPGMQNTEIYDELHSSSKITPVLVTHEESASFAVDAIGRSSERIGVCVVVPGAGVSNAFSGICEAYLDGVPMLVIAGSARLDTGKSYQLHQLDQQQLVSGAVKKSYHIKGYDEIVPAIFEAYEIAMRGCPGPVFIEIPVEIQMLKGEVGPLPVFAGLPAPVAPADDLIRQAAEMIKAAGKPAVFAGWGCKDAAAELESLAETLQAPVALTMQGFGVFPGTHPLHCGMSFGASAVPAARNAFNDCDCLIAIGTRFAEVATGSYGVEVPKKLIHIDIDPEVFDKNYQSAISLEGDASTVLKALLAELEPRPENLELKEQIRLDKQAYARKWQGGHFRGVNPASFIRALADGCDAEDFVLTDVGNHTFLMAEHFTVKRAGQFIAPCDFNCMGYAVPAALGVKLMHPNRQVMAVVGDGCFLMTCMEIVSAVRERAGIVYCVFRDGELAQISQAQNLPYNRKTCTVVPAYDARGIAQATGAAYIRVEKGDDYAQMIAKARRQAAKGRPVIMDVAVDYAKKTSYTKGVIKTNLMRFPLEERLRLVARVIRRRLPFMS